VTIPFFGIAQADGSSVSAATSAVATDTGINPNAGFEKIASFSSMGPRIGDSVLRPGITAPGVATVSTASGTGNGFEILSGTSMATPAVAGVAALVKQANPTWPVADLRAAVVQTAMPSLMQDYLPRNEGAGLAQAQFATATQAVVRTPDESVSFGYADLLTDFNATRTVTLHNASPKAVQFNIASTLIGAPAGVTITTPASINVNGASDATFPVTLKVLAGSMTGGATSFQDAGGYLTLTPSNSRLNGNVKLNVPVYFVGHSRSNLQGTESGNQINLTNAAGQVSAQGIPFILGQFQATPQGITQNDVRAVGARLSGTNIIFGVNTHNRTSTTLAFQEMDMCIDATGGPGFTPNRILIGINGSLLSSSLAKSQYATAVFPTDANCNINGNGTILFTIQQPTDGSFLQLPVTRASLGLSAANPRIKYVLNYYASDGIGRQMPGVGSFNAFAPAVVFGGSPVIAPNGTGSQSFAVDLTEIALTPALGIMLGAADNVSGASQGLLFTLP
jgi:hypothetical protein